MEHVVYMNLIEFLSKSQPYPWGLNRGGGGGTGSCPQELMVSTSNNASLRKSVSRMK